MVRAVEEVTAATDTKVDTGAKVDTIIPMVVALPVMVVLMTSLDYPIFPIRTASKEKARAILECPKGLGRC